MRRALSILLVMVFWMPAFLPLFGAVTPDGAGVPACCRRHGQHHCVMSESERAALRATGNAVPEFRAPTPRCPYQRSPVRSMQQVRLAVPVGQVSYAALVSRPNGLPQTQSKWRVSRERARQKRGPPADLLS
ncbi:MAG TPA: hypothetical protein VJU82_15450 [Acidobacteriaceae bacterium]|nr:hypothetical protein [Acidobacteriaceae bacterium]